MFIPEDDKVCENCVHYNWAHLVFKSEVPRPWGTSKEWLRPCQLEWRDEEGHAFMRLMHEDGCCKGCFAPAPEYLDALANAEAIAETERELDVYLNRQAAI